MNSIGIPELSVVFVILIGWMIPFAAAVWALVTLHRLRAGQQDIQRRMETLERLLKNASPGPVPGV